MAKYTRRQFLKYSAIGGAAVMLPLKFGVRSAYAFYQSPQIPLFQTALRGVGPGGIPVALPDIQKAPITGVTHYTINILQYQDQIVPVSTGLGPTTLWGYNPTRGLGGNIKPTHLGGIIIGQKGHPIQISFKNMLNVSQHILPVDTTIPGANQAVNRTATHLHGGLVPWVSDGGPFDWWNFHGQHGLSFLNNQVLNPTALKNSAEYYYPLNQTARFLWYHDHAYGITRLNAYAGVATALLLRDAFEASLMNLGLPDYIENGGYELPLIFQDKIFVGPNINTQDPGWSSMVQPAASNPGSLWYAHTYEPARWEWNPSGQFPPDPSAIPEFFGDTMLVNGTAFPRVTVQARRYRLRLLNACNARFLNLQLYIDDGSPNGITLDSFGNPTNAPFLNAAALVQGLPSPNWLQIGTEGGFLSNPALVPSNLPLVYTGGPLPDQKSLLVGPAERPDVIVDFSSVPKNPNGTYKSVILYGDAPAPFPSGDDRNDYFPGWNAANNPVNGTTPAGFGPNTRVLMRFNVVRPRYPNDRPVPPFGITTATNLTPGIDPSLLPNWGYTDSSSLPFPTRFLSLNEYFDEYGRLIQILGNAAAPYGSPLDGTATYLDYLPPPPHTQTVPATMENVQAGATEVWEIYNTTGDVHPMHFHLVNVQIINRQAVDVSVGPPYLPTGPFLPPDGNELGWKETVQMYPGTVTRVIMKFDLPIIVNARGKPVDLRFAGGGKFGTPPPSPRTGGNEYVWHCHILEHEEHDMMHSLVVT
jgi:spore coat protein A, manganese oxidase